MSLLYGMTKSKGVIRAVPIWVPWGAVFVTGVPLVNQSRPLPTNSQTAAILWSVAARVQWNRVSALLLVAFSGLVPGCTSDQPASSPPRMGHGAEEYQQITAEAVTTVRDALRELDRVDAQTNGCSPKLVAAFSREVEQLQVKSIRVRARAQAIQARGDAYFEAWSQNPSLPNNASKVSPDLPQMRQSFARIKLASQQGGEAFRPFLSGLRKLSAQLETNPDVVQTAEAKELIRTTRERGSQVVQALGDVSDELQAVIPVLARARAEANP